MQWNWPNHQQHEHLAKIGYRKSHKKVLNFLKNQINYVLGYLVAGTTRINLKKKPNVAILKKKISQNLWNY